MVRKLVGVLGAVLLASGAGAQLNISQGHRFLQAIKEADAKEVNDLLSEPGTTVINHKDITTGETALHITAKRGDAVYTRYLLQRGANPNLRDNRGNTPLIVAIQAGAVDLIDLFVKGRANVNLANGGGETPLILAVHRRDVEMARLLLAAGADPDQTDNLTGRSARDYALDDSRDPRISALFKDIPKRARRAISGPQL